MNGPFALARLLLRSRRRGLTAVSAAGVLVALVVSLGGGERLTLLLTASLPCLSFGYMRRQLSSGQLWDHLLLPAPRYLVVLCHIVAGQWLEFSLFVTMCIAFLIKQGLIVDQSIPLALFLIVAISNLSLLGFLFALWIGGRPASRVFLAIFYWIFGFFVILVPDILTKRSENIVLGSWIQSSLFFTNPNGYIWDLPKLDVGEAIWLLAWAIALHIFLAGAVSWSLKSAIFQGRSIRSGGVMGATCAFLFVSLVCRNHVSPDFGTSVPFAEALFGFVVLHSLFWFALDHSVARLSGYILFCTKVQFILVGFLVLVARLVGEGAAEFREIGWFSASLAVLQIYSFLLPKRFRVLSLLAVPAMFLMLDSQRSEGLSWPFQFIAFSALCIVGLLLGWVSVIPSRLDFFARRAMSRRFAKRWSDFTTLALFNILSLRRQRERSLTAGFSVGWVFVFYGIYDFFKFGGGSFDVGGLIKLGILVLGFSLVHLVVTQLSEDYRSGLHGDLILSSVSMRRLNVNYALSFVRGMVIVCLVTALALYFLSGSGILFHEAEWIGSAPEGAWELKIAHIGLINSIRTGPGLDVAAVPLATFMLLLSGYLAIVAYSSILASGFFRFPHGNWVLRFELLLSGIVLLPFYMFFLEVVTGLVVIKNVYFSALNPRLLPSYSVKAVVSISVLVGLCVLLASVKTLWTEHDIPMEPSIRSLMVSWIGVYLLLVMLTFMADMYIADHFPGFLLSHFVVSGILMERRRRGSDMSKGQHWLYGLLLAVPGCLGLWALRLRVGAGGSLFDLAGRVDPNFLGEIFGYGTKIKVNNAVYCLDSPWYGMWCLSVFMMFVGLVYLFGKVRGLKGSALMVATWAALTLSWALPSGSKVMTIVSLIVGNVGSVNRQAVQGLARGVLYYSIWNVILVILCTLCGRSGGRFGSRSDVSGADYSELIGRTRK